MDGNENEDVFISLKDALDSNVYVGTFQVASQWERERGGCSRGFIRWFKTLAQFFSQARRHEGRIYTCL